jgi:iron complex outermembrane recepter protein
MQRICSVLMLFFCSSFLGIGQVQVTVSVFTPDGAAEGANVLLAGKQRATGITLPNGHFTAPKITSGTYTLTVSYSGFQTVQKDYDIKEDIEITVSLLPLTTALQPVEVKALRAGNLAPFSKTNLSKSFIAKNNLGQDIPMLLNQTPNVVAFSDAGNGVGYTGLRIRGTDATRINMTINGIPYNDAESQGIFLVNMPDFLSSASSIQVQRGVGTSSNGPGAFGATMNFSTHENIEDRFLELNAGYGSFNTFKGTLKFGDRFFDDKLSVEMRLSHIYSDGFVDRAFSNLKSGYLSAAWHFPKSTVRFNAIIGKQQTYQAWYGISADDLKNNRTFNPAGTAKPGEPYDNETDNYWQNHYQLFYNGEWSKHLSFNTAFYLTTGRGYYEQYRADENPADYGLPGNENIDLIRQLWLDNILAGQTFTLQYRKNKDEIIWGGNWNVYPGQHFGKVIWTSEDPNTNKKWYDHDARKTDISSYIKWQRQIGKHWFSFADVQYRFVDYQISGFRNNPAIDITETWNFINPKAGLTYQKNKWTAYGSYAMGNKEPNRDDFEAGINQRPKREQLHNIELGVQHGELLPGLQAGINGFLMYYRDQLVLTGQINDVGAYTRTNLPESYRMGTELDVRYFKPKWGFNYSLALSINRAINYTGYYDDYDNGGQLTVNYGNTPIALSPGVVQHATLDLRILRNTEISFLNKYVGRQFLDNSGLEERSLNPFWVTDFRFVWNVPFAKLAKRASVILQVNNLFNALYEPNGYTFSYLYDNTFTTENFFFPMAGTNIMTALNIRL